MPKIRVTYRLNKDMFRTLKKMPAELAKKTAPRMVRKAGSIMNKAAKPDVPVGGPRKGVKAGKPHLKDTLVVSKTRKYKKGQLIIVAAGPSYKRSGGGGNHGHLVHEGFIHWRSGKRTRSNDFYQRTYDRMEGKIWLEQAKMARRAIGRYFDSIRDEP